MCSSLLSRSPFRKRRWQLGTVDISLIDCGLEPPPGRPGRFRWRIDSYCHRDLLSWHERYVRAERMPRTKSKGESLFKTGGFCFRLIPLSVNLYLELG